MKRGNNYSGARWAFAARRPKDGDTRTYDFPSGESIVVYWSGTLGRWVTIPEDEEL